MSTKHQLSLIETIFINLNVMMGAGIFINTALIAQKSGLLAGFCYVIVGILMLPLAYGLSQLLALHPSGGFYTFGAKEINPLAGFISAWGYFIGKLGSAMLIIHIAVSFLQEIISPLARMNHYLLDILILTAFICLNMLNIKTGADIQRAFLGLKLFPILTAIIVGAVITSDGNVNNIHLIWSGIPLTLPLVLYATVGFEAACSLSNNIKDAHINGPRAVLISYCCAITLAFLYQFFFHLAVGEPLLGITSYKQAFPSLIGALLPDHQSASAIMVRLLHAAIACSALGGAYGILFSNMWNLYTLAQHNHTIRPISFVWLNRHNIPFMCVIAQGILCLIYLIITHAHQTTLQQVSALGSLIAYTISITALIQSQINTHAPYWQKIIAYIGMGSCLLLSIACIYGLIINGTAGLILFAIMLAFGICMFFFTRKQYV